jgi:hypothetical protein
VRLNGELLDADRAQPGIAFETEAARAMRGTWSAHLGWEEGAANVRHALTDGEPGAVVGAPME